MKVVRTTPEQRQSRRAEVARLYTRKQLTMRDIATLLGVSYNTVQRDLHAVGVDVRSLRRPAVPATNRQWGGNHRTIAAALQVLAETGRGMTWNEVAQRLTQYSHGTVRTALSHASGLGLLVSSPRGPAPARGGPRSYIYELASPAVQEQA